MGVTAGFFTGIYLLLILALLSFGGPSDPLMKGVALQLVLSGGLLWWLRARWSQQIRPGKKEIVFLLLGIICGIPAMLVLGRLLY